MSGAHAASRLRQECYAAVQIVVQPDADNLASCRALTANGYVFDAEKAYFAKRL